MFVPTINVGMQAPALPAWQGLPNVVKGAICYICVP